MAGIEVRQLRFSYGEQRVLQDVSFTLSRGEILAVLGANGAGKSTLFKCILGARKPQGGAILAEGKDIALMTERELAAHMAYIPQAGRPDFGYTVLDVVLMGLTRRLSLFRQPSAADERSALDALALLGVEAYAEREFGKLSGGEQQLVMIARALVQNASFLLMDEPTSALDYGNQMRVLTQVKKLAAEGYGVLLSTHNPQHVLSFADRLLALKDGCVAAEGAPREVLTKELIQSLYGVDSCFADTNAGRVIVPFVSEVP